jgi:hypothetical protein
MTIDPNEVLKAMLLIADAQSGDMLDIMMPNGKPLRECTGAEVRQIGEWMTKNGAAKIGELLMEAHSEHAMVMSERANRTMLVAMLQRIIDESPNAGPSVWHAQFVREAKPASDLQHEIVDDVFDDLLKEPTLRLPKSGRPN